MSSRRVVITGLGVVCSIGTSVQEFWRNCLAGVTNVQCIPQHWHQYAKYKSQVWAPLPEIPFSQRGLKRIDQLYSDRVAMISIYTAIEALQSARLKLIPEKSPRSYLVEHLDPERAGVYMGTGIGGITSSFDNQAHQILSNSTLELESIAETDAETKFSNAIRELSERYIYPPRFNPFVVSMMMPNAVSAVLGLRFSLRGPNDTFAVACASGTVAIGYAFRAIKTGQVDFALAGGCEYFNDRYGGIFRGYDIAGVLAHDGDRPPHLLNRPFDDNRSGFLFTEGGGAVLVLEDLDHARNRNAPIIAEICGFAESFDGYSIMDLEPNGLQIERMIRNAVSDADISPEDINYVNAHGTGTRNNDDIEAGVIKRIFGKSVLVNSTKSLVGHPIGASGAIEAIATVLSLRDQKSHICKNLEQPIMDLNFIRAVETTKMEYALSNSFAFGGHNAGLVFKVYDNSSSDAS